MSKTRLPQTITLFGLLALSLHTAFASELTLDEAIQHALQHSPVLQGSKAGMQSADEQYKMVRAI